MNARLSLNRLASPPHTLRQLIAAIRPLAATRLVGACDAPNPERPGEAEKVAATRALIEQAIHRPLNGGGSAIVAAFPSV